MHEDLKQTAYFNLVNTVEKPTMQLETVDHLAGEFSDAVFDGLQAGLCHKELAAAVSIGHYLGSRRENVPPKYALPLMELIYWEVVYAEAEQFWLRRYRGDEE